MSTAGSARDLYLRILLEARGIETLSRVQERISRLTRSVAQSATVLQQYQRATDLLVTRLNRLPANAPLEHRIRLEAALMRVIKARAAAERQLETRGTALARSEAAVMTAQGNRIGAANRLRTALGALVSGSTAYNRVLAQAINLERQAYNEQMRRAMAGVRGMAGMELAAGNRAGAAATYRYAAGMHAPGSPEHTKLMTQAIRLERQLGEEQARRARRQETALARQAEHESNLFRIQGNSQQALARLRQVLPQLTAGTEAYYRVRERIARIDAEDGRGQGVFGRALGGIRGIVFALSRVLALTMLWTFAMRMVGGIIGTMVFKPLIGLAKGVLEVTESFRALAITFSGITGSLRSAKVLMQEIAVSARGLPLTPLQAASAMRQTAFIPLVARRLQQPGQERQQFERETVQTLLGLSTINPAQGIEGAGFALREALAGQFRSIRLRFDISPDIIAASIGKSLSELRRDPELTLKAIRSFVDAFVGPDVYRELSATLSAQGIRFKGLFQQFLLAIGDSGFYDNVVGRLRRINDAFDKFLNGTEAGDKMKIIAARISSALDLFVDSLIGGAETLISALTGRHISLKDAMEGDVDAIGNAVASIVESMKDLAGNLLVTAVQIGAIVAQIGGFFGIRTVGELRQERMDLMRGLTPDRELTRMGGAGGLTPDVAFGMQRRLDEVNRILAIVDSGGRSSAGRDEPPPILAELGEARARLNQGLLGIGKAVSEIGDSLAQGASELGPTATTLEQAFDDAAKALSTYEDAWAQVGPGMTLAARGRDVAEQLRLQGLPDLADRLDVASGALETLAKSANGLSHEIVRVTSSLLLYSAKEVATFGPRGRAAAGREILESVILGGRIGAGMASRPGSLSERSVLRFAPPGTEGMVIPRDIDTLRRGFFPLSDEMRSGEAMSLEMGGMSSPLAQNRAVQVQASLLRQLRELYEDPVFQEAQNIDASLAGRLADVLAAKEYEVREQFDRYRQFVREFTDDVSQAFKVGIGDALVDIFFEAGANIEQIMTDLAKTITRVIIDQILQIALVESFLQPLLRGALLGGGAAAGSGVTAAQHTVVNAHGGVHYGTARPIQAAGGWVANRRQLLDVAEDGTPEAVVPLRGGGVPVRWTNRGAMGGRSGGDITIINTVDPAAVVRMGAARDPGSVINPVVGDLRGRGMSRRVLQRDRRR